MKKQITLVAMLLFIVGVTFTTYQFLLQMSPSVMVPQLMRDFGGNATQVGFIAAGFFYSYVIFQIPSGALSDHIGPKRLLALALLGCAIVTLFFSYSESVNSAIVSRILMGILAAPAFVCTLAIAANWFPKRNFALLAGITELFAMLGGASTGQFLSYWVDTIGWRDTMFSVAMLGFALSILTFIIIAKSWNKIPKITIKAKQDTFYKQLLLVLKNPQIWLAGFFGGCLYSLVIGFGGLWSVPYMAEIYQLSTNKAGNLSALIFVGLAIGAPLIGWLSDYFAMRKPIMLIGTLAALILIYLIIFYPPSINVMRIYLLLLGLMLSVFLLGYALAKDHAEPQTYGAAIGLANMLCSGFGAPILQPLIGSLLEKQFNGEIINGIPQFSVADFQIALIPLIIMLIIALLSLIFIKEPCNQNTDES